MEHSGQGFVVPKAWVRDIVFTAGSALTIALLGPYGSYDEPLQHRLLRSIAFGFAGGLWIWPVMRLALRAGDRAGLPHLFTMVTGLIAVTFPVSAITYAIGRLFSLGGDGPDAVTLYFSVLAMVLPFGLAYLHVDRWLERPAVHVPATPEARAEPRLLDRLPPRLGREVLALEAEDHYVRVHTAAGSDLLLMRMADAIAEAAGIEGLRVHRSWWVARAAVASARTEGRRAALTLTNGLTVPVTRETVPEIRRAGWL